MQRFSRTAMGLQIALQSCISEPFSSAIQLLRTLREGFGSISFFRQTSRSYLLSIGEKSDYTGTSCANLHKFNQNFLQITLPEKGTARPQRAVHSNETLESGRYLNLVNHHLENLDTLSRSSARLAHSNSPRHLNTIRSR